VQLRFFIDSSTRQPHIYGHGVTESEVEEVARPLEAGGLARRIRSDRGRAVPEGHLRSGSRTEFGIRDHRVRSWTEGVKGAPAPAEEVMKHENYPAGWDEEREKRVLAHYEQQSDDEAVAEDEAAYESTTHTAMAVPVDLVPAVRELLAKRRVG
jgi:hypothetical protein